MKALGGVGRALAVRDFRTYWFGMAASTLGTWTYFVALGWLTWELTHSTFWLGLIVFIEVVPQVLLGPIAGAVVDRVGPHLISRVICVFAGCWAGGFAILILSDVINIWLLAGFTLVNGAAMSGYGSSQMALVAHLVPRSELSAAVALQSATVQMARFIGPAMAGFILLTAGAGWAFVVNSASYFIFIAAIQFTEYRDTPSAGRSHEGLGRQVLEGLTFAWRSFPLRTVLLATAASAILLRSYQDMMPAIADVIYKHGAEGLATLLSAAGVGALISALWLAQRGRTTGMVMVFAWGTIVSALALIAFVTVGNYYAAIAFAVVVGGATNAISIAAQILAQHAVTHEMRARVMSLMVMTFRAIPASGAFLIGWLASFLGLQTPIATAALLSLGIAAAIFYLMRFRGLVPAAED